jgi:hypothetical protein
MSAHDDLSFDEPGRGHGGLSGRNLLVIAAVAFVVLAALIWWFTREPRLEGPPPPSQVESVPEGSRNVTLYFAGADEPSVYAETREVAVGRRMDEQVRQVIAALIAGPATERGVSAIPAGTELLSVMVDADSGTVYLDFSSELVAAHPGGSAAEYCTVASIVRTVGDNFPDVQRVQLLVDGSQIETIAGHLRADEPFVVREWR